MSSSFIKRVDKPKSIYHITIRGINRLKIFRNRKDFSIYEEILEQYLLSKDELIEDLYKNKVNSKNFLDSLYHLTRLKNYAEKIKVLCYCFMPNHVHLILHQEQPKMISHFMHSLSIRYVNYFNKKYHRVGTLFQQKYAAKLVDDERYLLEVSKYVHQNPHNICSNVIEYPWSSIAVYAGKRKIKWIDSSFVQNAFEKSPYSRICKSYTGFVRNGS